MADDRLYLYKESRGTPRGLRVALEPADGPSRTVLDFPRDLERLEIPDLRPGATYRIDIRRKKTLKRLFGPKQTKTLKLEPRLLRILLTGSGRCGTKTAAHYLDGLVFEDGEAAMAMHEPLSEYVVPALIENRLQDLVPIQTGLGHNIESAPYYSLYPRAAKADRIIHIIRDGRRVVQSGLNRGWYQNDDIWNRLKPQFPGDAFRQSCHLWRQSVENSLEMASETFRLEDLTASADIRRDFVRSMGIRGTDKPFPHKNAGRSSSRTDDWDKARQVAFREIAGSLMDRFYPGWDRHWDRR